MDTVYGTKKYFQSLGATDSDYYNRSSTNRAVVSQVTLYFHTLFNAVLSFSQCFYILYIYIFSFPLFTLHLSFAIKTFFDFPFNSLNIIPSIKLYRQSIFLLLLLFICVYYQCSSCPFYFFFLSVVVFIVYVFRGSVDFIIRYLNYIYNKHYTCKRQFHSDCRNSFLNLITSL